MELFNPYTPIQLGLSGGCQTSLIDLIISDKLAGGGATKPIIEPLTVSENGTYEAPDGIDGYSPVTVNVKSDDEGLVITDFSFFCESGRRTGADFLDKLDTSKGTNFDSMFKQCTSLSSIPELDTSNGTNFSTMFFNCSFLASVPELDTSKGTNFYSMFNGCRTISSIPELDTSKGTNFGYMFYGCSNLKSIPKLDVSKSTNFDYMFHNCSRLTHLRLYNIKKALDISPCTALDVDSIVHTIKELHKVSSSTKLTLGSTNIAKISDLYCRVLDDTTDKIDMELCESTADGAMTLVDYASEKGWNVQ